MRRTNRPPADQQTQQIALDLIAHCELAMRSSMDTDELTALITSLSTIGQINPVTLRRNGDTYQLITGHRRCAAATALGWTTILARIVDTDELSAWRMAWDENASRSDVRPSDQSTWIVRALQQTGHSHQQLAATINKSASWVDDMVRMSTWPPHVLDAVDHGRVQRTVARELMRIDDDRTRDYYLNQAMEYGCTFRAATAWVADYNAAQMAAHHQDPTADTPTEFTAPPPVASYHCTLCRTDHPGWPTMMTVCPACAHVVRTTPPDGPDTGAAP